MCSGQDLVSHKCEQGFFHSHPLDNKKHLPVSFTWGISSLRKRDLKAIVTLAHTPLYTTKFLIFIYDTCSIEPISRTEHQHSGGQLGDLPDADSVGDGDLTKTTNARRKCEQLWKAPCLQKKEGGMLRYH